jgi:RimJ/RimL family protein N-acetyltransferase
VYPIATAPAYRLHTARSVVRCWEPGDAPRLKRAVDASLEHLRPWLDWAREHPIGLPAYVARLRRDRANFDLDRDYAYGIFDPAESEVIGGIGSLTRLGPGVREIGYWVAASHQGRGVITEAAAALTRVAFLVDDVRRVEIHCDPRNERSCAVARRLGYEAGPVRPPEPTSPCAAIVAWSMNALRFASSPCASANLEAFDAAGVRLL